MTYRKFKDLIHARLQTCGNGMTWRELKDDLGLPYDRPCPEWTRRLESEIGLIRKKGVGNALVWSCKIQAGDDASLTA